ncbi:MAG TPA: PDZ domain-containing protein [Candidatus Polarisedimenticolaceae bacterium]|nr:PDZ domain-containing protein [Candidatus Polarisedimenticolaceae bacterium]
MRIKLATVAFIVGCAMWLPVSSGERERDREESRGEARAWLGVWLSDAVDGGAQVNAVVGGGPADLAGLRSGDVFLEANGTAVGNEGDLGRVLRELVPGDALRLKGLRAGQAIEWTATLGDRRSRRETVPEPWVVPLPTRPLLPPQPTVWTVGRVGLEVEEITPALRQHFGAPAGAGVLVTRVDAGGAAAEAGVEVGDVVVRVGETEIRTERDLRGNLSSWNRRAPFIVEVVRARKPAQLEVVPPVVTEAPAPPPADSGPEGHTAHALELQIERLERRLEEMKRELERVRREKN